MDFLRVGVTMSLRVGVNCRQDHVVSRRDSNVVKRAIPFQGSAAFLVLLCW